MCSLVHAALDGVFAVLPLQLVANIVETFLKHNINVSSSMISIASDRLASSVSDVTLKPALTLLLSLLNDLITSADDTDAIVVALGCIVKLSRVHGKGELPLFEAILPAIVARGVGNDNRVVKEKSVNCLFAMLYSTTETG